MPKPLTGAVAVAALLLSLTACSHAAQPKSWISVPETFYLRPPGDKTGPTDKVPFHLQAEDVKATSSYGTRDHRLTVDVRGSEDVVRLKAVGLRKSGTRCISDTARVICDVSGAYNSWDDLDRVYPVAAEGSKPGDTAIVHFTFATKDGKTLTARTRVVVGEPVVQMRTPKSIKDVRPGSDVMVPVVVRNTGEVPVTGLGLELGSGDLDFRQRYANCRYPKPQRGHTAVCRFPDLVIPPGGTVVLHPAVRLRASTTRMYDSFSQEAWPLDAGPGKNSVVPPGGDSGDGPSLEAVTTKNAKDLNGTFAQGHAWTDVLLDTHADYQVSGAELHGSPGDEREFSLRVRNNGPGNPSAGTRLLFSPPPGTVLKEPMEAIDEDEYGPYCDHDGPTYTCDVGALAPGRTRTFDFTLRLDTPGEGTATLQDTKPATGRRDPDRDNDEAAVTVAP